MKKEYESASPHVLLQCFVNSSVETLNHASPCDLKSFVLTGVHMKQFGCYWRGWHLVSPAELNLVQLTNQHMIPFSWNFV